ncbi:hypothetical protein F4779DRAFT_261306 [Xylariaceae sp. FL0662B]|nr:hypothetical protein F4779DRAFT_261306 [Xylariaceae sp. FL0662B]
MLFKTTFISAVALLFANQTMGAAIEERATLTATNAYAACNCPNNCNRKAGSSCKFYKGPSDNSGTTSGKCYKPNSNPYSDFECIPN